MSVPSPESFEADVLAELEALIVELAKLKPGTEIDIRNTAKLNAPRIIASYEAYAQTQRIQGAIAELKWLQDNADGGGSWRRIIETRLAKLNEQEETK